MVEIPKQTELRKKVDAWKIELKEKVKASDVNERYKDLPEDMQEAVRQTVLTALLRPRVGLWGEIEELDKEARIASEDTPLGYDRKLHGTIRRRREDERNRILGMGLLESSESVRVTILDRQIIAKALFIKAFARQNRGVKGEDIFQMPYFENALEYCDELVEENSRHLPQSQRWHGDRLRSQTSSPGRKT